MTRPCAPACEPDDNGHCKLAEDLAQLSEAPITRLSAPVYVNGTHIKIPTDRIKGLAPPLMPTIAPDGMPRGGLLPDPYAIPDEGDPQ